MAAGARMQYEIYAVYRRIWLVHSHQRSPLGAIILPRVMSAFRRYVCPGQIGVSVRVAIGGNENFNFLCV